MSSKESFSLEEYNQQGLILFAKDKYEEAIEYFKRAINEDPQYIESYLNIAQVYITIDEFDDAKENLKKAVLIDKKNPLSYFHLGNIELLLNNTEDARTYYTKAISLGYDNIQIYINLAADAEERGEIETAISYYNKIIALDKFHAYAKARKAQILVALNRYPEALKVCDSLLELNPDIFEGYHYKFAILCECNKYDEAEAVLDRALELFPDDDALYYDKARLLQAKGQFGEALDIIDKKLQVTDENRSALLSFKAETLLALDRVDEAQQILEDEYRNEKNNEIAFLLNSINIAKGNYKQVYENCMDIIQKAEIDNYYYSALYYKAVSLSKLGELEGAKKAFKEALEFYRIACARQPGQIQLYFYRAMCHEELQQYDKALDLADFILNVDENLMEAHLIKMKVYEKMDNLLAAQREKEIILSKNPELLDMMGE